MPNNKYSPQKCLLLLLLGVLSAHEAAPRDAQTNDVEAQVRIDLPAKKGNDHATAAVVWLKPAGSGRSIDTMAPGHFTLLQKNRTFSPHLLVIPVGSSVSFPNADPFFHNVFSLFNGKRFDLGLYEAGTSKDVVFSREGVSYIFCNIHPEMSAVILALSTPYFTAVESGKASRLRIPEGEYELHVWVEGLPQPSLDQLTRKVHFVRGALNSATLDARDLPQQPPVHLNKFGQPYEKDATPIY
jgi:plastocyanin